MATKEKHNKDNISIAEAVETLSNIADLKLDKDKGMSQLQKVLQDPNSNFRTVHWVDKNEIGPTITVVKDTFRVILKYLNNFYKQEFTEVSDEKAVEGIKTIMVLVGEAAKKLDRFTTLFHAHSESVTNFQEYKELEEFYHNHVAKIINEGIVKKTWLLALARKPRVQKKSSVNLVGRKPIESKHVFMDMDSVKKDTEYELFFLRKEDGNRFFNPRLIRNIKLVCDLSNYFGETLEDDPFLDIQIWRDHAIQNFAKDILNSTKNTLKHFYRDAIKYKDQELVELLNKAIFALLLSANPKNLMHNSSNKSCFEYFSDFKNYLRSALYSREHQKLINNPPISTNRLGLCLLDTLHSLCCAFFISAQPQPQMNAIMNRLSQLAYQELPQNSIVTSGNDHPIWNRAMADYTALTKLIKKHPNGPLIKDLDFLQNSTYHFFDPIWQGVIPGQLYSLYIDNKKVLNLRIPSPTQQEFINKPLVTEEFKNFIRSLEEHHTLEKHLLINLQDRTSWKEHYRSVALEELMEQKEFSKHLIVVTLPKDTEFYHQMAPYHEDNEASVFISHLKEHLEDENCGFLFPSHIKAQLFNEFVDGVIQSIHHVFFSDKKKLNKQNRLDFIELFYLFLQLKLIEITNVDSFSFTCKDSIDIGSTCSAEVFMFLNQLNHEKIKEEDYEYFRTLLYSNAILTRERLLIPERFDRMISVLKINENLRNSLGFDKYTKIINSEFGKYYSSHILKSNQNIHPQPFLIAA